MKPIYKNGVWFFADFPEFTPNLSPKDMFQFGSFGGTYWRPIYSSVTGKHYKNVHLNYPEDWWEGLTHDNLTRPWKEYDVSVNKYKKKVGTTLEFWEEKGWITKYNPYGWVHWYCDFFMGKRGPDDQRQIQRWSSLAGDNGRFRKWLITLILKKDGKFNDTSISPAIRQTLQHWGYKLTLRDFKKEVKKRQNKLKK